MEINLKRYSDNGESTLGILFIDGVFQCYTIEDQFQEIKVNGETRIPDGTYKIKFREIVSGMTTRYRKRYSWFTYHLHLQDVPYFKYVYIHSGNTSSHTEGCLIVGNKPNNNQMDDGFLGSSAPAYKEIYLKISHELDSGYEVSIKIENIG